MSGRDWTTLIALIGLGGGAYLYFVWWVLQWHAGICA